jgi:hypothetical protein
VVLEEGMDWQPIAFNSADSQFKELRDSLFIEIARIFRIPAALLQDPAKSGVNSTETFGRFFITFTLSPLLEAWEQAFQLSLFTREDRRRYYLKHDLSEFTRAESQSRWQANVAAVINGILTANEVRAMEDVPPVEGGDTLRVPLNTGPATPHQGAAPGQIAHMTDPTQTLLAPRQGHARAVPQPPRGGPPLLQSREALERALATPTGRPRYAGWRAPNWPNPTHLRMASAPRSQPPAIETAQPSKETPHENP